ncbi:MAG: helix-turn-helix transcriptional regulator [Solirubrobacterales bacterium]|nr:helix-turn-helix transcriptional regulator [Solirubrobacterales bacterium]
MGKRARKSAAYKAALEEQLPYEEFARLVIRKRMQLDLTQEQLAERMGTSPSVVSRLESGQHRFSFATMRKLAKALNTHLVYGFQDEDPERASSRTPKRDLVVSA